LTSTDYRKQIHGLHRLPQPALWLILVASCVGCRPTEENNLNVEPKVALAKSRIVAQGQILPAAGIVQLSAAPGDVVQTVHVSVGQSVEKGERLLTMRSEDVTQAQLKTLLKRREAAVSELENTILQARQRVAAAELKIAQIDALKQSLVRKSNLLQLAEQQVRASEQILDKLKSISQDAMTSEFVGQLEIDRQRIAVGEAELSYRQQVEAQRQAVEDLDWSSKAADEEKLLADQMLAAVEASQAIEVLDLEIEALQEKARAAQIVAPVEGVVLAINASAGEASIQMPLVEMADIENLVCEVEVNDMDAAFVEPGQVASISSGAFGDQLITGRVSAKFNLVGRPQLRPLNPLARADYRTVTAIIELDDACVAAARDWLQLQVDVEIKTNSETAP
jgi:ABC exporter DevB family membrane fusion protein